MLRCLTKSKVDCSFQNNEFRFKNRGFTQFFFFWFSFFFFSFLRSTLDEITKQNVKNYGVFFFLERRGKKRRKNTVHMEEKKLKKKGPDGIRTRDLRFPIIAGSNPPLLRDRRLTTWPPSHNACCRVELE